MRLLSLTKRGRTATLHPKEESIEEGNLREPARERDLHDALIGFGQSLTGGLKTQAIEERAKRQARMLLELTSEGGTAQRRKVQHLLEAHWLAEVRYQMTDRAGDCLLVMRIGGDGKGAQ